MVTPFDLLDLATQPRFLLPALFPAMAYLGWSRDRGGRLRNHGLAVIGIDVFGFLLAMALEALPVEAAVINELQGVALLLVGLAMYGVWRYNSWSIFVQGWALVAVVSVAFWLPARVAVTLSGGVIIPCASAIYLTWQDRRLAPLLLLLPVRIGVGVLREGFTTVDLVVALSLAVTAVVVVGNLTSVGGRPFEVLPTSS